MNEEEIRKLIQEGESESLEIKTSLSDWKSIVETISAFANSKGGILIIGVKNNGEIRGIKVGKDSIESLTNRIIQNTDPKIYPSVEVARVDRKEIIVLTVKDTGNKPYLAFGKAFKRAGKSTHQMSRDEYERMILEKHKEELRFDNRISKESCWKDIDEEKVRWFLREGSRQRGLDIPEDIPVGEALMRLQLLQDRNLTNAAVLLFGKCPQKFFIQSEVKCVRFRGNDVTEPMVDMKIIGNDIISQVKEVEKFIFDHISLSSWIEGRQIQRQEKWEYPPMAIREALSNALAHRDYKSPSKVQVRIFDDRMEFWNPGMLPEPLTLEDLKRKHKSIPRNPLIARQFFWIRYVEEVGSGTNKMVKWCADWGLPEPDFDHITGDFVVTLWKSKLTDEYLDSLGLNNRQKKAIAYLMEHKKITKKEYMNLTNISKTPAFKDINGLLGKKVIVRKGSGRSAYYILQESVSKRPKRDQKKTE